MEKDFLDLHCKPSGEFIKTIWRYILELESLQGEFSDLCREHFNVRFAEYSFLYHDMYHFHEMDLIRRGYYQPKDLISFRNSAEFLYQRFNSHYSPRQNKLENYFMRLTQVFSMQVEHEWKEFKESEPAS